MLNGDSRVLLPFSPAQSVDRGVEEGPQIDVASCISVSGGARAAGPRSLRLEAVQQKIVGAQRQVEEVLMSNARLGL